ncbi:MAG: hypothetical protein ACD_23C00649G0002 [uncultured bacterium]|nr:MAG: hypothetical protein ACD_23C00649G0002 [uncultured bacterium]
MRERKQALLSARQIENSTFLEVAVIWLQWVKCFLLVPLLPFIQRIGYGHKFAFCQRNSEITIKRATQCRLNQAAPHLLRLRHWHVLLPIQALCFGVCPCRNPLRALFVGLNLHLVARITLKALDAGAVHRH